MKQKDNENRKTLVFTVVLGFFVMGTVVYQHLSSPGESTMDDFSIVEQEFVKDNLVSIIDTIEPDEWDKGVNSTDDLLDNEVVSTLDEEPIKSFSEAFAEARSLLGSGKIFSWNGSEYSTSYAEEENRMKQFMTPGVPRDDNKTENFAEEINQDTLKNQHSIVVHNNQE
ncbi:MAG: hypothetical protein CMF78_02760 [Candidatus Marinimicrobia bacterium]|jgi:hypothetical protein|nr:hypothetical protein [Candidatus Neomarinimicrobiota bacterium]|tara:strand:+ start:800 stop:1306 length:507 start_codon:yes stop_codon:yes gene_type:complete